LPVVVPGEQNEGHGQQNDHQVGRGGSLQGGTAELGKRRLSVIR
jgi:hypothetical protein